jgi:hypothetical protein
VLARGIEGDIDWSEEKESGVSPTIGDSMATGVSDEAGDSLKEGIVGEDWETSSGGWISSTDSDWESKPTNS